ncbi:MAG TPA: radical SAM protein [Thermoplasmata archaeon]|nr:radical SAM protein [Thermoplasmata archaeon]
MRKVLMTTRCTFDCRYCVLRNSGVDHDPVRLARDHLGRRDGAGIFLSSGISPDPDEATLAMIRAARVLRDGGYTGYIHLKVLPGVSRDLVGLAARYADRMSVNIESPSAERLSHLSPSKDFRNDILRRQSWIRDLPGGLPSGQTTQMIVGLGESDLEALRMAATEYRAYGLRRVYYSPFRPTGRPDLPSRGPPNPRVARLYRADALLRLYRWPLRRIEAAVGDDGFLLEGDPKTRIVADLLHGPVDPAEADGDELLLVPGIGPRTARRLAGRVPPGATWRDLRRLGVPDRARPFLRVGGTWQTTWKRWC